MCAAAIRYVGTAGGAERVSGTAGFALDSEWGDVRRHTAVVLDPRGVGLDLEMRI
jgi:hypothetical protein